jgi:hypothetical protein
MKMIKISIIAAFTLFLTTGIAGADELDDLDVTIRVVETDDDVNEVEHELHLPDSAADSAREHAEDDGHENEGEHHSNDRDDDGREGAEDHEDGAEDHEEGAEDHEEGSEDHEDSTEDHEAGTEDHVEESGSDDGSTPNV